MAMDRRGALEKILASALAGPLACTGLSPDTAATASASEADPPLDTYACSVDGGRERGGAFGADTEGSSTGDGSSSSASTTTGAGTGTTGAATTTGTTDAEGTSGTTQPELLTTSTTAVDDYAVMDECSLVEPCAALWHQTVEPSPDHGTDDYPEEERCLLEALRDREPGAYRSVVHGIWANGEHTKTHVVHLDVDGRVTVVLHEEVLAWYGWAVEHIDTYAAAKSCTLRGAEFFSECLADYDDDSHLYECLDPELWWTECGDAAPWCPCGAP